MSQVHDNVSEPLRHWVGTPTFQVFDELHTASPQTAAATIAQQSPAYVAIVSKVCLFVVGK